jgi:molybdopterin synthase sulfur carrier subunit
VKLLYFAWVRQKIGRGEETIETPQNVRTVGELAAWLGAKGGGYAEAFADMKRVRAAVNQEHVDLSAAIKTGDEVAFFPPVTGG